jgi:hypothetical protein
MARGLLDDVPVILEHALLSVKAYENAHFKVAFAKAKSIIAVMSRSGPVAGDLARTYRVVLIVGRGPCRTASHC